MVFAMVPLSQFIGRVAWQVFYTTGDPDNRNRCERQRQSEQPKPATALPPALVIALAIRHSIRLGPLITTAPSMVALVDR